MAALARPQILCFACTCRQAHGLVRIALHKLQRMAIGAMPLVGPLTDATCLRVWVAGGWRVDLLGKLGAAERRLAVALASVSQRWENGTNGAPKPVQTWLQTVMQSRHVADLAPTAGCPAQMLADDVIQQVLEQSILCHRPCNGVWDIDTGAGWQFSLQVFEQNGELKLCKIAEGGIECCGREFRGRRHGSVLTFELIQQNDDERRSSWSKGEAYGCEFTLDASGENFVGTATWTHTRTYAGGYAQPGPDDGLRSRNYLNVKGVRRSDVRLDVDAASIMPQAALPGAMGLAFALHAADALAGSYRLHRHKVLLEARPELGYYAGDVMVHATFSYRSVVDGLVRLVDVLEDFSETSSAPGHGDVLMVTVTVVDERSAIWHSSLAQPTRENLLWENRRKRTEEKARGHDENRHLAKTFDFHTNEGGCCGMEDLAPDFDDVVELYRAMALPPPPSGELLPWDVSAFWTTFTRCWSGLECTAASGYSRSGKCCVPGLLCYRPPGKT